MAYMPQSCWVVTALLGTIRTSGIDGWEQALESRIGVMTTGRGPGWIRTDNASQGVRKWLKDRKTGAHEAEVRSLGGMRLRGTLPVGQTARTFSTLPTARLRNPAPVLGFEKLSRAAHRFIPNRRLRASLKGSGILGQVAVRLHGYRFSQFTQKAVVDAQPVGSRPGRAEIWRTNRPAQHTATELQRADRNEPDEVSWPH